MTAPSKVDFLLVSKDENLIKRCKDLCDYYQYENFVLSTAEESMDYESMASSALFVVLSAVDSASESDTAGMVQVIKQVSPTAYLIILVDKKVSPEAMSFIKKSGANMIMIESEIYSSSKLEYVASQKIRSSYVPVKSTEIAIGSKPDFNLYHLMPLNKRFLPVLYAGNDVSKDKHAKMQVVGELYVKRDEVAKYSKYLKEHTDLSAAGLKSRCRAQFLSLETSYIDLVLLLTDRSEVSSFQYGKELYEKCSTLANDLISGLGAVGDAWDIINNSSIGTFGSVDRAPSVAAYAGLFSLVTGVGDTNDVMLATLIADVGLLELPPSTLEKVKNNTIFEEKLAELQAYQQHPIVSLNQALSRRLPIPERLKNIILCTHEQFDQKGFPNKVRQDKIPEESQLILFSELLDKACILKLGQERVSPIQARKDLYEKEKQSSDKFGLVFLSKIKDIL